MASFKTFEQIDAWQKARELTREIYTITTQGAFARDYGLKDQIRRACVSIMSNIAEGSERSGTAEFVQFLAIAKGSSGETRSQLYVALDQNYLSKELFERLCAKAWEISRMISGLISYLLRSGIREASLRRQTRTAPNLKPETSNLKLEPQT